jgi:signal transduction histidine kinase
MPSLGSHRSQWELATESIVVQLRWFGVAMGYVLVQTRTGLHNPSAVRAFLALGAGFAALDTAFHRMGEVFLKRWPLFVSLMESIFITLLCYQDTRVSSPFRWYFLLSSICAAIRFPPLVAWVTFALHATSFFTMAWWLGWQPGAISEVQQMTIILAWATWASSSLAGILRTTGSSLATANDDLELNRAELERRVAERTDALREAQARATHQEKMAAFGLLAAGIAHEVGNPLAALSSLIQMLHRRNPDAYTSEKLDLADRQLSRIQRTIRELIDFARPASHQVTRVRVQDVIEEALGIAKYYHCTKDRLIVTELPADLPTVRVLRDHLVQVLLNLTLNAVDATSKGGSIRVSSRLEQEHVVIAVEDNGRGIDSADQERIFKPYFTTKSQGTGLGLFVSKKMVEEQGGELNFESTPGTGTTFSVRLPVSRLEHSMGQPETGVVRP